MEEENGDEKKAHLEQFFERWKGNEYHAKKFIADSKYSAKSRIDYYTDGIKIATFYNRKKIVTTYLPKGKMCHVSYKNFKKLMRLKLNIDDEKATYKKLKKFLKLKIDNKKSKHLWPIAHSLLKD